MTTWGEVESAAPDLAAAARGRFDAFRHKVLATLREDGAPRVSGIEVVFALEEVWLGSMPDSRKSADLRRDGRCAVHSGSPDPADPENDGADGWSGDAKLAGTAIEVTDDSTRQRFLEVLVELHPEAADEGEDPFPFDLFRLDIAEVVTTSLGDPPDHLVIESWHEGRGVSRIERT